jgi:hypothetical protein
LHRRFSNLGQIAIIPSQTADLLIFYEQFAVLLGTILDEFELNDDEALVTEVSHGRVNQVYSRSVWLRRHIR